jgi:hypothetical protein
LLHCGIKGSRKKYHNLPHFFSHFHKKNPEKKIKDEECYLWDNKV